jgi:4-hydroxybenzoate polyprenyltransferase
MRVHQAVKNLFIFMPLFFAGQILAYQHLVITFYAFIAFSLSAFAIYIFNDIQDINEDRLHPIKKKRPLASGLVSIAKARLIMYLLVSSSLILMSILSIKALGIMLGYILMNIAYSLYLKKIAVVDVSIIATGFILRLLVGSVVSDVPLSNWIIVLTFLLALFIAFAKRRDDLQILQKTGNKVRQSITFYNPKLLDYSLFFLAVAISFIYFLYTTSPEITSRLHTNILYYSTIFVVLGLARYMHISIIQNNSGSPITVVFTDLITQLIIIIWFLFFGWVIYQ